MIKLMLKWSIVSSLLIASFWAVSYFINGTVPTTTQIFWDDSGQIVWNLPFAISAWWDIILGPIFSILLVPIYSSSKKEKHDYRSGLICSMIFGFGIGFPSGFLFSPNIALPFALAGGAVFGLIGKIRYGFGYGLAFSLGFGLFMGLTYGLIAGLTACLIAGLAYGLIKLFKN